MILIDNALNQSSNAKKDQNQKKKRDTLFKKTHTWFDYYCLNGEVHCEAPIYRSIEVTMTWILEDKCYKSNMQQYKCFKMNITSVHIMQDAYGWSFTNYKYSHDY
jgi:hypothetical protein